VRCHDALLLLLLLLSLQRHLLLAGCYYKSILHIMHVTVIDY
jgi:hypothetical protein